MVSHLKIAFASLYRRIEIPDFDLPELALDFKPKSQLERNEKRQQLGRSKCNVQKVGASRF